MKSDFPANGKHFLLFSQTAVSQLLPVEAVFSSTGTCFSAKASFLLVKTILIYWKQYFFIPSFLSANGLKFGGSQIFKKNHIFASGHQFLSFLKVEAVLPHSKNILQYPTGTSEFSAYGNSIFFFLNRAILVVLAIISVIKRHW